MDGLTQVDTLDAILLLEYLGFVKCEDCVCQFREMQTLDNYNNIEPMYHYLPNALRISKPSRDDTAYIVTDELRYVNYAQPMDQSILVVTTVLCPEHISLLTDDSLLKRL